MTNRNANKSSPGQPAGQGAAGDAAPQQPTLPQQPPRGYDTPNFASQEHPSPTQQRALTPEPRRRPEEGSAGPAAPPPERVVQWGEPRPRRRQDREAGPSDKQVYVPPVTLPPNREHQAMDLQKIQVAPSLLKGVDERNRPTMRRIPVQGMPGAPPGIPDGQSGARPGGVRAARVGVGSGVWPPPEDESSGSRGPSSRKQRPTAAAAPQPAAVSRAGLPPTAARHDSDAVTAAAAAAVLAARRRRAPLALFALLVFLGSATVAGFWVLWRAANPTGDQDSALAEGGRVPTPEPTRIATSTPSAQPEHPPPAAIEPPPTAERPVVPDVTDVPMAPPMAPPGSPPAHSAAIAASRPSPARPAAPVRRPPRPLTTPDDVYDLSVSPPSPPPVLPSAPSASPTTPPGTTAPPRPFP
ncbi:hypothetical protein WME90_38395 [Sorangium sp. So ce375]|uniref:hypothetical protein n=1 Tax=Sorangium sp. So ce375 TaxID=3133306 RepID=UPI003F5B23C7